MVKFIGVMCIAFILTLTIVGAARAHFVPNSKHNVKHAIVLAWCGDVELAHVCKHGREALVISTGCEAKSGSPWAGVGKHDYWGIFQVSEHWRNTVRGFKFNVWAQAQHAYRVFRLVGWSHWECAYRMGVL